MSATLVAGPPRRVGERWIIPVSSLLRARPSPRWVLLDNAPEAVVVEGAAGSDSESDAIGPWRGRPQSLATLQHRGAGVRRCC